MNRAEFRARIRGILGDAEPTGNPRFSDSLLDAWVDDEVTEVSAEQPWAYTRQSPVVTLIPDVDTYLLPEGTLRVDYVQGENGERIDFLNEFNYANVTGGAVHNSMVGYTIPNAEPPALKLAKAPASTGTVTVHCFVRTAMPADDVTDVPVPQEFWDIVIFRVAAKCAMRDRNTELFGIFTSEADNLLRKIAHTQKGSRTSELQQITLLRPAPNTRWV